jgi:septal ring factor EnvC (AmiA/AmiB activator)
MTKDEEQRFEIMLEKVMDKLQFLSDAVLSLSQKIDHLEAEFRKKFDIIDRRLTAIEVRLDRVEERLDRVEKRLDRVEKRLGRVEKDVSILKENNFEIKQAIKNYEPRIKRLETQMI